MRIGLFGGTFDPPHQAHLAASLLALKRLKLDSVWWLVTPGNPLKNTSGLAPLQKRIAAARGLTRHPGIHVTGIEAVINTRYTYNTMKWLIARCPRVRFVWVMGADNLRSFHRWQKVARNSEADAVRRHRPPGAQSLRRRQPGRPGVCPRAHCGTRSRFPALPQTAGLGVSAWPQIGFVLDGAAGHAPARRNPGTQKEDVEEWKE